MILPSANTIQRRLGCARNVALAIRKVLEMTPGEANVHPELIAEWERRGRPSTPADTNHTWLTAHERQLIIINSIMQGHGVERAEEGQTRYCDYVNMGETYAETVLYDLIKRQWRVESWGACVEYHDRDRERRDPYDLEDYPV